MTFIHGYNTISISGRNSDTGANIAITFSRKKGQDVLSTAKAAVEAFNLTTLRISLCTRVEAECKCTHFVPKVRWFVWELST